MRERECNHKSLALPVIAAAGAAYFLLARPWHMRWGATSEELEAVLPGDSICPVATARATHAITINASPNEIWPWIAQIGQDRGGFYSYTSLENTIGCEMTNTFRIVPEWQSRTAGDTVWFGTPKHFQGRARMVAAIVEPERALVFATPADWERMKAGQSGVDGTWALVLAPNGPNSTRLIARGRGAAHPSLRQRAAAYAFWEPAHFIMERKMLLTIKRLAEALANGEVEIPEATPSESRA
jgi:hypothetical protein